MCSHVLLRHLSCKCASNWQIHAFIFSLLYCCSVHTPKFSHLKHISILVVSIQHPYVWLRLIISARPGAKPMNRRKLKKSSTLTTMEDLKDRLYPKWGYHQCTEEVSHPLSLSLPHIVTAEGHFTKVLAVKDLLYHKRAAVSQWPTVTLRWDTPGGGGGEGEGGGEGWGGLWQDCINERHVTAGEKRERKRERDVEERRAFVSSG